MSVSYTSEWMIEESVSTLKNDEITQKLECMNELYEWRFLSDLFPELVELVKVANEYCGILEVEKVRIRNLFYYGCSSSSAKLNASSLLIDVSI